MTAALITFSVSILKNQSWSVQTSKIQPLDVLELRKVRLYGDSPRVQQTQSQIASGELQGVPGGRGELRCLGDETDTSCLYGVKTSVTANMYCHNSTLTIIENFCDC